METSSDKAAPFDGVIAAVYMEADFGSVPRTGTRREQAGAGMHRLHQ